MSEITDRRCFPGLWRLHGSGMLCGSAALAAQPVRAKVLPFSGGFHTGLLILVLIAHAVTAGCH